MNEPLQIIDNKENSTMTLQSIKKKFFIRANDRSEQVDFELNKTQVKQLRVFCNQHLEDNAK